MPNISGLEVLKQIRQAKPNIMVVMVSGESSQENVSIACNGLIRLVRMVLLLNLLIQDEY